MNDDQLLRYSRHIMLDEIGIEGQERILAAHAVIWSRRRARLPHSLGSAGVGRITIVDNDVVDMTNLQRQIAHTTERIGMPKVESIRTAVHAINPGSAASSSVQLRPCSMNCCPRQASCSTAPTTQTRQTINAACVSATAYPWSKELPSVSMAS
jgi:molybdopterin/thiamine biosynthesis adenylyltransferase